MAYGKVSINTKDRRVIRTRESLKKALLQLVCFKEPGSISIKELTEAACVNRATFYAHYRDVYELYDELEHDAMEKIRCALMAEDFPDRGAIYHAVIDVIQSNADTFMVMMREGSSGSFEESLAQILEMTYLKNELTENHVDSFSEERRFLLVYHTQGCIGMVKKWIKEGCRYPKEAIVEHMMAMDKALHE